MTNNGQKMGVSQWKEYGKKYRYWEYFEGVTIREIRGMIERMIDPYEHGDCEAVGYEQCKEDIISRL